MKEDKSDRPGAEAGVPVASAEGSHAVPLAEGSNQNDEQVRERSGTVGSRLAQWWGSWHFDKEPSLFDAITAVVAIVGVGFVVAQWKQTDAALNEAREANRIARQAQADAAADGVEQRRLFIEQLGAAKKTAEAAEGSAAAAKESAASSTTSASALLEGNKLALQAFAQQTLAFKNEQRPWVFVSLILGPAEPKVRTDALHWEVRPMNSGKSTALRMRSTSLPAPASAARGSAPPPEPNWESLPVTSGTPLGPGQTGRSHRTGDFIFDENGLGLYLKGVVRIYLWNRVWYCDGYRRLHWVQTCAFHVFGTPLNDVQYCDEGNTTDSNDGDQVSPECGQ